MRKKILFLSTSGFAICFLLLIRTSMNSCIKDDVRTDTVTVIERDTTVEKNTLLAKFISQHNSAE